MKVGNTLWQMLAVSDTLLFLGGGVFLCCFLCCFFCVVSCTKIEILRFFFFSLLLVIPLHCVFFLSLSLRMFSFFSRRCDGLA